MNGKALLCFLLLHCFRYNTQTIDSGPYTAQVLLAWGSLGAVLKEQVLVWRAAIAVLLSMCILWPKCVVIPSLAGFASQSRQLSWLHLGSVLTRDISSGYGGRLAMHYPPLPYVWVCWLCCLWYRLLVWSHCFDVAEYDQNWTSVQLFLLATLLRFSHEEYYF